MARGRGGKKAYKPSGRPRRPGAGPEEEVSEEEEDEAKFKPRSRGLGAQANTVGMLPPSDDEEEEDEGAGPSKEGDVSGAEKAAGSAEPSKPSAAPAPAAASSKPAAPAAKKAVQFSESEDDSDEDDSEDESDDDDVPPPKGSTSGQPAAKAAPKPAADYLSEQSSRKPKGVVEERDPEEIRKEMERLALVRNKREEDRKRRVAAEGWDRFAPVTDTNKPPGTIPSDHPSARA